MAKVTITSIPAFNGDYELDLSYFTNRELNIIKKIAGVRGGELEEAVDAGDNDLSVALAVIAVRRSGREIPAELLWDDKVGGVKIDLTDEEDDGDAEGAGGDEQLPPASAPDA